MSKNQNNNHTRFQMQFGYNWLVQKKSIVVIGICSSFLNMLKFHMNMDLCHVIAIQLIVFHYFILFHI